MSELQRCELNAERHKRSCSFKLLVNTFGRLQNSSGSSFLYPENKRHQRFKFEEAKLRVSFFSQFKKLKTAVGFYELQARLLNLKASHSPL